MQKGIINVEMANGQSIRVEVSILETRKMFGRTEYRITPVSGSGEVWKEQVTLQNDENAA